MIAGRVPADRDVARPPAEAFAAFAALAEDFALPVVQSEATDLNLPTNHPMNLGFDIRRCCRGRRRPRDRGAGAVDAQAASPGRDAKVIHSRPIRSKRAIRSAISRPIC